MSEAETSVYHNHDNVFSTIGLTKPNQRNHSDHYLNIINSLQIEEHVNIIHPLIDVP